MTTPPRRRRPRPRAPATQVEEAALLDGAGRWKIFRQLILPMAAAPLATLAVLTYITARHEYMWPLVTGDSEDVRVLTVALNAS